MHDSTLPFFSGLWIGMKTITCQRTNSILFHIWRGTLVTKTHFDMQIHKLHKTSQGKTILSISYFGKTTWYLGCKRFCMLYFFSELYVSVLQIWGPRTLPWGGLQERTLWDLLAGNYKLLNGCFHSRRGCWSNPPVDELCVLISSGVSPSFSLFVSCSSWKAHLSPWEDVTQGKEYSGCL